MMEEKICQQIARTQITPTMHQMQAMVWARMQAMHQTQITQRMHQMLTTLRMQAMHQMQIIQRTATK